MISAITAVVASVGLDRCRVRVGPIELEVLLTAADVPTVVDRVGGETTFHTLMHLEGDASGGNLTPRLLGFVTEQDREFFSLFVTVKGIGPRKAMRAMAMPAGEVAAAIENRDVRTLVKLPQVGKRAAEQIVAELAGKAGRFVTVSTGGPSGPAPVRVSDDLSPTEADAVATLVTLGERPETARLLLVRAKDALSAPNPGSGDLVRTMLRLRG